MKIAIGNDQHGLAYKQMIMKAFPENEYVDVGSFDTEPVSYPGVAEKAAKLVAQGECERGILICGTGIGMAMTADKVPGVRATVVQTNKFAKLCREHNDCNVLCLSGRFTAPMDNCQFVETFLTTEFGGGRHEGRVAKIMAEDER